MHEWEIPSWRSRSAASLIENLSHTPVWIIHGEWDRSIGGGVPVEHSRQMAQLMEEQGYTHKYTEIPRTRSRMPPTQYMGRSNPLAAETTEAAITGLCFTGNL